jgi:LEA14-like dessication related protein
MRLGWVAVPLLIAIPACSPVRRYQEAARSLRFSLDRVEPNLELAFPLDRSRITFDVTIGVENPSTVPFHIRGFEGAFRLETDGVPKPMGEVRLSRALDLPAGGKAQMAVALSFGYQDLAERWPALQAVLHGESAGSWDLDGDLRGDVYGIPVQLPVHTRRTFGTAP